MKKILLLLISICLVVNVLAQDKRALTFDDILKWNRITESHISNDGKIIVYKEELKIRISKKRYDLFLIDLNYEDSEYISFFDNFTFIHDQDPVCHFCDHTKIMAYEY